MPKKARWFGKSVALSLIECSEKHVLRAGELSRDCYFKWHHLAISEGSSPRLDFFFWGVLLALGSMNGFGSQHFFVCL